MAIVDELKEQIIALGGHDMLPNVHNITDAINALTLLNGGTETGRNIEEATVEFDKVVFSGNGVSGEK